MLHHAPSNHYRKQIIEENLLQYKNQFKLSSRDLAIIEEYVSGALMTKLAIKYGISNSRVQQIIEKYVLQCNRLKRTNK